MPHVALQLLFCAGWVHRDISSGNLMYTRDEQGRVVGVLNDFDLSVLASVAGEFSTERTGTVPFMATDLLRFVDGCLPHLYGMSCASCVGFAPIILTVMYDRRI